MAGTDDLIHEHRAIEHVLDTMERAARRLQSGQDVDPAIVEDCIEFVSGFADRCHHAKEEELLFPLLEERGLPREGAPIGEMLGEHEKGRAYIARIKGYIPRWKAGDDSIRLPLAEAVNAYVMLLRHHIVKEDSMLLAAAEVLSDEDNQRLKEGFDDIEEQKIGPGVHEEYHHLLDSLVERSKGL